MPFLAQVTYHSVNQRQPCGKSIFSLYSRAAGFRYEEKDIAELYDLFGSD